jgi:hypothetical protein
MIYSYEQFAEWCDIHFTGDTKWSYQDHMKSVYGPNWMQVAPPSCLYKPRKYATMEYEETYDTT